LTTHDAADAEWAHTARAWGATSFSAHNAFNCKRREIHRLVLPEQHGAERHGFLRLRLNATMETHQVMNGSSARDFNQSRQPWRLALVDADMNLHHAVREHSPPLSDAPSCCSGR
jgi:hypothetical protein